MSTFQVAELGQFRLVAVAPSHKGNSSPTRHIDSSGDVNHLVDDLIKTLKNVQGMIHGVKSVSRSHKQVSPGRFALIEITMNDDMSDIETTDTAKALMERGIASLNRQLNNERNVIEAMAVYSETNDRDFLSGGV